MSKHEMVEAMELTPAQRAWANIHEHHCRMAGVEPWTTDEEIEALDEIVDEAD